MCTRASRRSARALRSTRPGKSPRASPGDSTVAYSFAFAHGRRSGAGLGRAAARHPAARHHGRAGAVSHHVSDVGAICNDASVVAILARCASSARTSCARWPQCFGHRMMMDRIVPGGTACDLDDDGADAIRALLDRLEAVVRGRGPRLRSVALAAGPRSKDRRDAAGIRPAVRCRRICRPRLGPRLRRAPGLRLCRLTTTSSSRCRRGPRATWMPRIWVRIEEVAQSMAMIRQLLDMLEPGPVRRSAAAAPGGGWRRRHRGVPRAMCSSCVRLDERRQRRPSACPRRLLVPMAAARNGDQGQHRRRLSALQ